MRARYKILVVDDDPEDRALLAEDLREIGCDPVFAMDGTTAIRVARDERPDVIILDVNLPAGSGITVL
jgi:CheY-like chemotaxis protein